LLQNENQPLKKKKKERKKERRKEKEKRKIDFIFCSKESKID
jgi:hypothetical protein